MASNFSHEHFPKWFAKEFFRLHHKFVHTAEVTQFEQDEDSLRARMFYCGSEYSHSRSAFVFPKGKQIVIISPLGRYRSTVEYRQRIYSKTNDWTDSALISQEDIFHGKTIGLTKRFGPAFEVKSSTSRLIKGNRPDYIASNVIENQLRKYLKTLIYKSNQLERARSFLYQRLKVDDYKQAGQICAWLDSIGQDATIDSYLKYGFCVVSSNHTYYITNNSWGRNVQMITVVNRSREREDRLRLINAAFGKFKKDFSEKIHGSLLSRLTD